MHRSDTNAARNRAGKKWEGLFSAKVRGWRVHAENKTGNDDEVEGRVWETGFCVLLYDYPCPTIRACGGNTISLVDVACTAMQFTDHAIVTLSLTTTGGSLAIMERTRSTRAGRAVRAVRVRASTPLDAMCVEPTMHIRLYP